MNDFDRLYYRNRNRGFFLPFRGHTSRWSKKCNGVCKERRDLTGCVIDAFEKVESREYGLGVERLVLGS
jgi:hypothetical protein